MTEGTLYPSLCSKHSTNCELCSTIAFTLEENLKEFKSIVWTSFHFSCISKSGIADHMMTLGSTLRETAKCFLQSGCTIFQSHQQWMRVRVPPYPQQHVLISVFDSSHPSGYETLSHWGFDFHFPDDMMLKTFHVFFSFAICMSSLEKIYIQVLCLFWKLGCLPLYFWAVRVIYIIYIQISYHIYDLEMFSPLGSSFTLFLLNLSIVDL